jgi:serine/threonine protein kinase
MPEILDNSVFAGRYRVIKPLGKGERKHTYLAWDTKANRQVALAVVASDADPRVTQREVDMLGKAGPHDNIVTLYDFDLEPEHQYLVFEYLPGGDLREHCQVLQSKDRHMPFPDFFRLARQLCRVLARIHDHGIIHRDVSMTNVWLDERSEAHLGDFDTAISLDEPLPGDGSPTAEGYVAPELLSGVTLDGRADLYSLGAVLYEVLAGVGPAVPTSPSPVVVPPSTMRDDVPPRLDRLILSMLAPERERRPASAEAVLQELRDIAKTADLESLIGKGESTWVEFKQTMQWDTKLLKRNKEVMRACVKTVCAFLNGAGGALLIGVSNNGELTGLSDDLADLKQANADWFELTFREELAKGLDPEASHFVTLSFPFVRGVQICRVEVDRSPQPVFLVTKGIPTEFYVRQEGETPQAISCASCGDIIRPPEFYVRKGNTSRPLGVKAAHEYIREHWGWRVG